MDCSSTQLSYRQTGAFSKIALDYIDRSAAMKPFYRHSPDLDGIRAAIDARKRFPTDRRALVKIVEEQYRNVPADETVKKNIASLLSPDTFTITTAHQNNIFTGPLYFIYKILHAIRLADELNAAISNHHFVPVYYMGSEDADLAELNHIQVDGEKLVWNTGQTGAVGRMKVDKELIRVITQMEGQLLVLPHGSEFIDMIRACYTEGTLMEEATFRFVHALFAGYGLIVLLPDRAILKKQLTDIFEDDLLRQTASGIVEKTAAGLHKAGYKVQANPREINLFYLQDGLRGRIERVGEKYVVHDSSLSFSEAEILEDLKTNPERFSPNVILRGIYQETILPNIVFIGGGGETAYWLQLKDLFEHYGVPFPVLLLRNSFLVIEKRWQEKIDKIGFTMEELFLPEQELLARLVLRESENDVKLNGSLLQVEQLYDAFKKQATAVDATLQQHVEALRLKTVYRLRELEKKMMRAEKRKFGDRQRQIHAVKEQLFPHGGLQERYDNIGYYYAKWGKEIIRQLYLHSPGLEQEFVVVREG